MATEDGIILCQPDKGKGCSVCCGLFNRPDISRDKLEPFLQNGSSRVADPREDLIFTYDRESVRDIGSHICPYQGFVSAGKPGCLLHPACNEEDCRDRSLFKKKICDAFFCPAHDILNEHYKVLLIQSVDDWYPYAIAIADPESFIWIADTAEKCASGNKGLIKAMINRALEVHGRYLNEFDDPFFFYSLPEYSEGKELFSLGRDCSDRREEKEEILSSLKAIAAVRT